jgi:hypothetical protein
MAKEPWDVPDPPKVGDASNDITFQAVGEALSQWEFFEGNLSLAFSFLLGSGYGNLAAGRSYGSVESFRGRVQLIEAAAEVYFKYNVDKELYSDLKKLLNQANRHWSGRRNEIAHGIVQPWFGVENEGKENETAIRKGFVLFPAYYATRKRRLPETTPFTDIVPKYVYSSVEIKKFGKHFYKLGETAIHILTRLTRHSQGTKLG